MRVSFECVVISIELWGAGCAVVLSQESGVRSMAFLFNFVFLFFLLIFDR